MLLSWTVDLFRTVSSSDTAGRCIPFCFSAGLAVSFPAALACCKRLTSMTNATAAVNDTLISPQVGTKTSNALFATCPIHISLSFCPLPLKYSADGLHWKRAEEIWIYQDLLLLLHLDLHNYSSLYKKGSRFPWNPHRNHSAQSVKLCNCLRLAGVKERLQSKTCQSSHGADNRN